MHLLGLNFFVKLSLLNESKTYLLFFTAILPRGLDRLKLFFRCFVIEGCFLHFVGGFIAEA